MSPLDPVSATIAHTSEAARAAVEPEHATLPVRVDARSASLVVIAVLLVLFGLHWASAIVVPLLLGVMFSYALSPAVDLLQRWRLPRPLGAALLLVSIMGAIGWGGYALRDDVDELIESLPQAARKLKESALGTRDQAESNLEKVQKAASQLEQATRDEPSPSSRVAGVARVQIEKPAFNIKDHLVFGGLRLAEMGAQVMVMGFITYFLLAAGDSFRRKLVRIAGPTFARRKLTVQALNEITEQIHRYLVVQLLTSVGIGIATAAAFWMLGMRHAAVWGIAAMVMNLIPYIGTIVLAAVSAVVALTQFGTIDKAVMVGAVSVVLHFVSGYLLAPWLTGRTSRLNAVIVFVGVLAWGWLLGVWGLLLGAPILMAIKAVCDRTEGLKSIGELMGGDESVNPGPLAAD